jgi:hypothetical protein
VNGQRTGDGKYIYANGDRYEGAFVVNKKHGIGRFTSKEKGEYHGTSSNMQVNGKMESNMARAPTSMQIKISTRVGGCSVRSTAKEPIPTIKPAQNLLENGLKINL